MNKKKSKIEFIIPTYERMDHLMCVISSIRAQTVDRWKIHVIADHPPDDVMVKFNKIKEFFKDDERIRFTVMDKRYNDWGHTLRNYGLEHATEDWVLMTGEDNYYTPIFVNDLLSVATPNVHFVYCDMIHNWTNFQYLHISCKPKWGQIDIGNFIARTEYANQLRLDVKNEQADGKFVEEYIQKFPNGAIRHIKKPLYVHN